MLSATDPRGQPRETKAEDNKKYRSVSLLHDAIDQNQLIIITAEVLRTKFEDILNLIPEGKAKGENSRQEIDQLVDSIVKASLDNAREVRSFSGLNLTQEEWDDGKQASELADAASKA